MKLNVLSLFDGIGCSRLALKKSPNLKVNKYFYSEVDKNCIKLLKTKYPDDIYVGAVENIDIKKLPKIDLLIGGSPCQDLSNAHKGDGIGGVRSSLFYQFVKIKNKLKPKYFLLENVKNKWSKLMDKEIGVSGIELNSLYLSGQYRPRVYWSNIEFNEINQDSKNKTIKDYLEKKPDNKYFFNLNLKTRVTNEFTNFKYNVTRRPCYEN